MAGVSLTSHIGTRLAKIRNVSANRPVEACDEQHRRDVERDPGAAG